MEHRAEVGTMARNDASLRDAWHAEPAAAALTRLNTGWGGLSAEEAAKRLAIHGPNELPATRRRHPLLRFLAQFHNPLIYSLLAAAVAAWLVGHGIDAVVILAVVVINAIVGFIQEGKAEKALNAIRRMISPQASVIRDGRRLSVAVAELVPGDIVLLEPGDRVPADLRLMQARGLLIEEAVLTGESVAAEKQEHPVAPDAPLGDRRCMAYSGTLVAAGQGRGVVVATGGDTEIGRITSLIQEVEPITTPLLVQMTRFARTLVWFVLAAASLLFVYAVLVRAFPWADALVTVIALTVAVIPEGLPAVITITLALGVQRMAARNAAIRRLPAVETLGAVSVICSDKTGTLTRNEMTARRIVTADHTILVTGSGYAPEGDFSAIGHDDDVAALAAAAPMIRTGLLCNNSRLRLDNDHWVVDGDPMEGALVALAMKAGLDPDHVRGEWRRLDEIPFDARYRFMATLNQGPGGAQAILVKGAPERVMEMCTAQLGPLGERPLDEDYWAEQIALAAAEGERVLGFALLHPCEAEERLSFRDLREGLTFLGIVGFIDPPREEAIAAVAECHAAGIAVKMITGDHAATAAAIARQLGLAQAPEVTTGATLEHISDADLIEVAARTDVFARTSPEHKLRIVRALQARGAVVAMTGDGVNDAPALKQANVGVAMGRKGTEAAKEAAEMVLLDDNFASIVAAVHEGRTVYDNVRKEIAWQLPTNGGEGFAVIAAILVGFTMPMTATQILWVNLITSVTLGLALAFEPSEPGVMRRPPRAPDAPLLSRYLVWRIFLVSTLFGIGALGIFFYALGRGHDLEVARTLVVNIIVGFEAFYLFNVRYFHMTSFTLRGALGTRAVLLAVSVVIVAQFAFTYTPFMNELFQTRPVAIVDGMIVVAAGFVLMFVLEVEKKLLRHFRLAP